MSASSSVSPAAASSSISPAAASASVSPAHTPCAATPTAISPFDAASFRMIDVGAKRVTRRKALAGGWIAMSEAAFALLSERRLPKGDALALAEIAGVLGAKATGTVIPLCHPLALEQVRVAVELEPTTARAHVFAEAAATATTGVEMEALMAVNAALLTLWDLLKGTDPALEIGGVRLLEKTGGKSGRWLSPGPRPAWMKDEDAPPLAGRKAAVVVLSDRAAAGTYVDRSGPELAHRLEQAGAVVAGLEVIADDGALLTGTLRRLIDEVSPDLILTAGGTGLGPRDRTPETLAGLFDRPVPGLGERLRQDGAAFTANAWLSRAVAGLIGHTLVIALPGSPKAVAEGWGALSPLLPHAFKMIDGGGH